MDMLDADDNVQDNLQILKSLYYAPVAQKKMHADALLMPNSHAIAQNFVIGLKLILIHDTQPSDLIQYQVFQQHFI